MGIFFHGWSETSSYQFVCLPSYLALHVVRWGRWRARPTAGEASLSSLPSRKKENFISSSSVGGPFSPLFYCLEEEEGPTIVARRRSQFVLISYSIHHRDIERNEKPYSEKWSHGLQIGIPPWTIIDAIIGALFLELWFRHNFKRVTRIRDQSVIGQYNSLIGWEILWAKVLSLSPSVRNWRLERKRRGTTRKDTTTTFSESLTAGRSLSSIAPPTKLSFYLSL